MPFDPVSMGLMAAGTLFSNFAQSRINKSNLRDIKYTNDQYNLERANQDKYRTENEGTVADTLATYGKPATDARVADATNVRQSLYASPLMDKNFNNATPSDFNPNDAVTSRNAATASGVKMNALGMANTKGALDAYGDATALGNILSGRNADKIGMVARIAQGSERAGAAQQSLLPGKLEANQQNAGATWQAIGDWLKLAGGVSAAGGFGGGAPTGPMTGTQTWLARQGAPSWLNSGVSYTSPWAGTPSNYGVYSQPLAPIG